MQADEKDIFQRLTALETTNKQQVDDIKELLAWKRSANLAAAGIGSIWMAVTGIGAWVYSNWTDIRHAVAKLGQ